MEDFEIRQAFAIIQDRVKEIKTDQDWKEKIAEEWNQTAALEEQQAPQAKEDQISVYSYSKASRASQKSKASFKSLVASEKAKQKSQKQEWDRTTVASSKGKNVEDKVASQIAEQMLKDNQKLRGVHSNQSIKKILEKEAKRQLLLETNGGVFVQPVIAKIVERGEMNKADPSNLPYLHKCPAV